MQNHSNDFKSMPRSCLCGRGAKCQAISSAFFMLNEHDARSGHQVVPLCTSIDSIEGNKPMLISRQVRESYLRSILPRDQNFEEALLVKKRCYVANHHFHPRILDEFLNIKDGKVDLPWTINEKQLTSMGINAEEYDKILSADSSHVGRCFLTPSYKFKATKKDLTRILRLQENSFVKEEPDSSLVPKRVLRLEKDHIVEQMLDPYNDVKKDCIMNKSHSSFRSQTTSCTSSTTENSQTDLLRGDDTRNDFISVSLIDTCNSLAPSEASHHETIASNNTCSASCRRDRWFGDRKTVRQASFKKNSDLRASMRSLLEVESHQKFSNPDHEGGSPESSADVLDQQQPMGKLAGYLNKTSSKTIGCLSVASCTTSSSWAKFYGRGESKTCPSEEKPKSCQRDQELKSRKLLDNNMESFKLTKLNSIEPEVLEDVEILLSKTFNLEHPKASLANLETAELLYSTYNEWSKRESAKFLLDRFLKKSSMAENPKASNKDKRRFRKSAVKCRLLISENIVKMMIASIA